MKDSLKFALYATIILIIVLAVSILLGLVFNLPFIATSISEISTAIFDFWTIGHLLVGIAIFVLAFTIGFIRKNIEHPTTDEETGHPILVPPAAKKFVFYWIYTMIVAVVWEVLENTLFLLIGLKVKLDSPINISTDIIIWGLGALGSWLMTDLMFSTKNYLVAYYLYGAINLLAGLALFLAFGYLTGGI